ncbi:hypothetical protein [Streptomyces sp. NPDC055055]
MADERYQWLDQEAAERLLRGEPVDAADDHARTQAKRLSEALGSARVPVAGGELPGEAAALAAFRAAAAARAAAPAPARTTAGAGASAETFELDRVRLAPVAEPARRWGRSLRYGLAAAFAAVTVGGVAVAAGTGVLPLVGPAPASSVTAGETADTLVSKEPGIRPDPETPPAVPDGDGTPGASPSADAGSTPSATPDPDGHGDVTPAPGRTTRDTGTGEGADGGADPGTQGGDAGGNGTADLREKILRACRDYRSGKLDTAGRDRLNRTLRDGDTLRRYCDRILSGGTGTSDGTGTPKDGSEETSDGDKKKDEDRGRTGGQGSEGRGGAAGAAGDTRTGGGEAPRTRLSAGLSATLSAGLPVASPVRIPVGPPAGIDAAARVPLPV